MCKVSPDKNMRAARLVELRTMRVAAEQEIAEQQSAGRDGDPVIVERREQKVAKRKADLAAIDAELDAIESYGRSKPSAASKPKPRRSRKNKSKASK